MLSKIGREYHFIVIFMFTFIFILLFDCFGALVLCRLVVRAYHWTLQHRTLSRPAGAVVF
jgi:hypothetical protein